MPEQLIKGLPDGVELVGDFLPTTKDDYELIRIDEEVAIYKGARPGSAAGAKVKPADGYVFVQTGHETVTDMRTYQQVEGRPRYQAAKKIPAKTITVTAMFIVDNELAAASLEEAIKTVPTMPGYVSHETANS